MAHLLIKSQTLHLTNKKIMLQNLRGFMNFFLIKNFKTTFIHFHYFKSITINQFILPLLTIY
jgi:hypothetical protein